MTHSLEEISEKFKLGIFSKDKNDEEIKKALDTFLYYFAFLITDDRSIKEEKSYIKNPITIEGQKFYEEVKEYNKSRREIYIHLLKSLDESIHEFYRWEISFIFGKDPNGLHRLENMITTNDVLDRFNIDILTLLFSVINIWDVLGKFGLDKEVTETNLKEDSGFNTLKKAWVNELGYKKVIQDDEETVYTRILSPEFIQKYSPDINRMYEIYYANYSKYNFSTYPFHELIVLFQNSILLNIDVDELLKKYSNITRDEILTLCLYKLDMKTFNRYIELMNNCDAKNKKMILEFIKPMNLYFPYLNEEFYDDLINKDIYYGTFKSELFTDRYFSYNLYNMLLKGDYNRKHHYIIDGSTYNFQNDTIKTLYYDTEKNSIGDLLRENFYDGYFYYILKFQTFFKEQINALEQICQREDARNILLSFLEIKKFILDSKCKTKLHLTTRGRSHSCGFESGTSDSVWKYSDEGYIKFDYQEYRKVLISSLESSKLKEFFKYCQKYFKTYTMDKDYDNNDVREYILESLENIVHPKEEIMNKVRKI